jgi:dihydroorotate dehydrogenase
MVQYIVHLKNLPIHSDGCQFLSGHVKCDLSASTGVHDHKAFIKQLLAGATTVQIASALIS